MTGLESMAVFAAGIVAGTVNAAVGSGTLIAFPVLLAVGYPPVTANVTCTLGLVSGAFSGAYGYRRELAGQRSRLIRLGAASVLGGVTGGVLLLLLPAEAFAAVVPALIVLAGALVLVQPKLAARLAHRRRIAVHGGVLLWLGIYGVGVYGGYFGAAQGVLAIALMGLALDDDLQRLNAARNVLSLLVNLVAASLFLVIADVAWLPSVLLAAGSLLGGVLGARLGRRLPPMVLRGFLVAVGLAAIPLLVLD
ncbi:sulfite exporter TauE/SafE family protein [Streptomyces bathyalis]|uniref:Probable membrane transporter protein n=2 Tax=Streptomyces bathyalis TaxID=2710756 RepID=A0A7T1WV27_9ACTN|nr:sulfite exporter TauE/SafE family protein [Streptomyces bathyalis]